MWANKMCSVLNPYCKLITQQSLYRIGMKKINPSLQFLLPKNPFLQGRTSVNAVNGTLTATRKEVWSSLFSWVFRIFFCSLETGMQTWPIHWPQQHQKKLLFYPVQPFNDVCNGIAVFWGILASQPNSLPRSLCLHSLGNLVVSFSLRRCTMKHKCSYSLNDFLINSNRLVTFSSHNWHAVTGRGNYCGCAMGQEPSFRQT